MTALTFTHLTESTSAVSTTLPAGLNGEITYVLAQLCSLTYDLYSKGISGVPARGTLLGAGSNTFTYQFIGSVMTTSEPLGLGADATTPGAFVNVPIGFVAQCTNQASQAQFNVVALRGTQTFDEWLNDANAVPGQFLVGNNGGAGYSESLFGAGPFQSLGFVHGGFLSRYTVGTAGATPQSQALGDNYQFTRPSGSLAAQIDANLQDPSVNTELPMFVTGHSLGAALAVLCAMDLGVNYVGKYPSGSLTMINFAGPRVGVEFSFDGTSISALGETAPFVTNYQKAVRQSFLMVNAADLVPLLPPPSLTLGSASLTFSQVSDTATSFCVQTGSIGGNHSLLETYLPYAAMLANGL